MTMNRIARIVPRKIALALPLLAVAGVAHAQYAPPPPPPPGQYAPPPPAPPGYEAPPPPPPATYIATVEPVYYNGQPVYWYNNHWYWRDGGGNWNYYRREPDFLRQRRMQGPPARHFDDRHDGRRR